MGYAFDQEVELNPSTGLVGMPAVTPDGIQAQCLLNPKLRLGGRVKIDKKHISGIHYLPSGKEFVDPNPTSKVPTGSAKYFSSAATSPTGSYKILLLEHNGDNYGTPWYSNLTCMAVDRKDDPAPNAFRRSWSESADPKVREAANLPAGTG
jgi:hypothetical protein